MVAVSESIDRRRGTRNGDGTLAVAAKTERRRRDARILCRRTGEGVDKARDFFCEGLVEYQGWKERRGSGFVEMQE